MPIDFILIDFVAGILIVLGIGLIVAETLAPAHGALAFLGSLMILAEILALVAPEITPIVNGSILFIGLAAAFVAALIVSCLASSMRRLRVVTGREAMIDATGSVLSWNGGSGHILVHGERWQATGPTQAVHSAVRVVGIDGLTLRVQTTPSMISTGGPKNAFGE